jgi:glycerol uptake facilitator-like aquaporin
VLVIFGNGVDCQVVLSGASTAVASSAKGVSGNFYQITGARLTRSPLQDYLSINFAWAAGESISILCLSSALVQRSF